MPDPLNCSVMWMLSSTNGETSTRSSNAAAHPIGKTSPGEPNSSTMTLSNSTPCFSSDQLQLSSCGRSPAKNSATRGFPQGNLRVARFLCRIARLLCEIPLARLGRLWQSFITTTEIFRRVLFFPENVDLLSGVGHCLCRDGPNLLPTSALPGLQSFGRLHRLANSPSISRNRSQCGMQSA